MLRRLYIYESPHTDPYENLAIEKYLLDNTGSEECILYLWQNQNTVVIGRNQNPWVECRTSLLEAEGGKLARRLSGGGAVFHDLGNLNFTFLVSSQNYDVDRQLAVIQAACAMAGIATEKSGRNDLLADGRKFSGNAFYHSGTQAYHHGTLLINADMDKLQRYLSPSKAKLEAKGVTSVRSRVVNLNTLSPGLTCQTMKTYMAAAFQSVYGSEAEPLSLSADALRTIRALQAEYSSWNHLYGSPLPFTLDCQSRFAWGSVQLQLEAKGGVITAVRFYTDAMDWQLSQTVEQALTGCRFCLSDMTGALRDALTDSQTAEDLCHLLAEQAL